MRPSDELPSASEKGRMISELARKGLTGIDLARIANLTRKEISALVVERIIEMKNIVGEN